MSVKRYEWVACDEHSCHCDVVESAEGDMVDYEDYAALEARCAALTAENAGLKHATEQCKEYFTALVLNQLTPYNPAVMNGTCAIALDETPATDAFLAEVRAQGVEMAVDVVKQYYDNICAGGLQENREYEESIVQPHLDGIDDELKEIIAQLRKGGAAEEKQSFLSDEDCHAFIEAFTKGAAQ